MPAKVVDASAVAALLFVEPEADKVALQMEGFDLTAPSLLPYEIASVAKKKMTRHPEMASRVFAALERLDGLHLTFIDVSPLDVVRIAKETDLSTYDASYLLLSRLTGSPLVTLDERLARAAKRKLAAGVKLPS